MYKIGVIGDKQSVLGFKAVGLNVYGCSSNEEARNTLKSIVNEEYAIIYITENFYGQLKDTINEYNEKRLPAIIPIPGMQGTMGLGIENIKKAVERAVGADILFNND